MDTYIDRNYAVTSNTLCSYMGTQESVRVPEKIARIPLKVIGKGAFEDQEAFTSVTIPKEIERIGEYAFSGCKDLSEVIFEGVPKVIGSHAFHRCNALRKLDFINFSMNKDRYTAMKNGGAYLGQGWRAAGSMPAVELPDGLLPAAYKDLIPYGGSNSAFTVHGAARVIPANASDLFYQDEYSAATEEPEENAHIYKLPLMTNNVDETQEIKVFMQHIPAIHQEQADVNCEIANDELLRTEKEVHRDITAVFLYDDSSAVEKEDRVFFHAVIRWGYYFWQSGKSVTVDGKEYFIYRRHHAMANPRLPYLRQDVAVCDRNGPLEDVEEARKVYGKYRLLTFL